MSEHVDFNQNNLSKNKFIKFNSPNYIKFTTN